MQEIALFLSSIAGIATAAAVKKFPKNKTELQTLGTNPQIKNQINSLRVEKDILTKSIARIYENDSGLTKIQRDKLLVRYQHQLGMVLTKVEKLQESSKHPDLGPLGDGLVTLMDQKLSQLDQRLYELSSKISVANAIAETKEIEKIKASKKIENKKQPEKIETKQETLKTITDEIKPIKETTFEEILKTNTHKPFELTTLTEIPSRPLEFPFPDKRKIEPKDEIVEEIIKPQETIQEKIDIIQSSVPKVEIQKQETLPTLVKPEIISQIPQNKPKPTINLPEEDNEEDDEDDLEKIKGEIMKTLSKLEQAEVE